VAAEPESLLPLPTLTEPEEPESSELLELLESSELLELPDVPVVPDVVAGDAELLSARATAVTTIVPATLSATRAPVAAATRRRPWSLRIGAFMGSPSAGALCERPDRPVARLCDSAASPSAEPDREHTADAQQPPGAHPAPAPTVRDMPANLPATTAPKSRPVLTRVDGAPVRVLVVDDEPSLTELLSMALRYEGWDVQTSGDGLAAVRTARTYRPDAVVLDVMLPDLDGLEVLRRLRADGSDVPVLFLTAKDGVEDRIAGLTAGGDDYVTKPFSLEEVVARLRGLVRRSGVLQSQGDSSLVVGDLTMDEDSHEVRRAGELVQLTATEFELLRFLMRNPRRVLSKAQILDRVWNYDFGGQANVVELYISYLRKKIDAGREPMIHTLRGAGYILKPSS
jgi:two-component system OmpR family response regulator